MGFEVRQASSEDIPRLFAFIEKAYGAISAFKIPRRWYWEFTENPYWKDSKLPVWIALDGDKIAGQTCAMRVPMQIGGVSHEAAWSVDTMVLPEYQGKGIGTLLQKANAASHPVFMSLSMSAANRRVKAKLGSIPLPPVSAYWRQIRLSPAFVRGFLAEKTKNRNRLFGVQDFACRYLFAHRLIALLAVFPLLLARIGFLMTVRKFRGGDALEEVAEFDSRVDELWARVSAKYPTAVKRERKYLNWKFSAQPDLGYRLFILKNPGDEVRGLIVLRGPHPAELSVGVIAELFADPDDEETLARLLDFGIASLSPLAEAIEFAASIKQLRRVAERRFFKVREVSPMFSGPGVDTNAADRDWFLSKGDHDWDQVHPRAAK